MSSESSFSVKADHKSPARPHSATHQQVIANLQSDPDTGLSQAEAQRRLGEYGPNELDQQQGASPVRILVQQVFNAMTLVLLLALAASLGIQAWIEGGILGAVIVLNILIGFFQTLKAEKTVNSLRSLGNPMATAVRDRRTLTLPTSEIVPGDIVDLQTGDSVPADLRLISCVNLKCDEAMLTGESMPVTKDPEKMFDDQTGPGDRINVAFSSTIVVEGRGRGIVTATGMGTEIGMIAAALNAKSTGSEHLGLFSTLKQKVGEFLGLNVGTPLQRKLSQLFIWLFICAVLCAIVVLAANGFNSRRDVIIYAVTTAVGTIPVSLLLVLTVTMAAGTKKMLERNVMVRNLSSLEALGGITDICSDKTGTITQGKMIVKQASIAGVGTYTVEPGKDVLDPTAGDMRFTSESGHSTEAIDPSSESKKHSAWANYLNVAAVANLATIEQRDEDGTSSFVARGTPTEVAVKVFAARFAHDKERPTEDAATEWEDMAEYAFDSDVKRMSVVARNKTTEDCCVFTKGAVERVLDCCETMAAPEALAGSETMTSEHREHIIETMETMASQGLRVLAFAYKPNASAFCHTPRQHSEKDASAERHEVESRLTFLGLIGIYDPPRLESHASVLACHDAGIVVHMLTGDHPQTAGSIATAVGIISPHTGTGLHPSVMVATAFDAMTDEEIDALPQLPLVVARCSPSTKVRMIEALHRRGRYVAMTGDGVNDSPSLKHSDIGIAMGTGSDVAKESSDIILTDDNFASILNAIEEGRRIFDNIQKFILHVLAANLGFVIALLSGLAFKDSTQTSVFQISPVQIIWMLMATGSFCETGLGFETAVPDILHRPPHNLKYGVFTPELFADILVYGLLEAACILGSFTTVIYGFNNGNLGHDCNNIYSESCEPVFRARATCFAASTWVFLLFAWELIDTRRSFFDCSKERGGVRGWARHLWGNKFLFFAVVVVGVMAVPTLYIPVLDREVFLHSGIGWEWGVVVVAVVGFMVGVEGWKWGKRAYFRRIEGLRMGNEQGNEQGTA